MGGFGSFSIGSTVDRLRIVRELGRGAFGRVYLAEDELIGRSVALKVVPVTDPREPRERERVLREARAAGRLNSPHVVALYHVEPPGEIAAWRFAMEYVAGPSLEERLAGEARLEAPEVRRLARQLCRGLGEAHDAGVVHGDVKPGNVLLVPDGTAKLSDFGLSRILEDLSLSSSRRGSLAGTPLYMAPEVIDGARPTPAADVWSLGVVLYRALAGRLPFQQRNLNALFFAIQAAEIPLLDTQDTELAEFIHACLARAPGERPYPLPELAAEPRLTRRPRPAPAVLEAPPGRESEWKEILARLDQLVAGHGGVVLLGGEQGIGKTALAQQVRGEARRRGLAWLEAPVTPLSGVARPLLESLQRVWEETGKPAPDSELFGSAAELARRLLREAPAESEFEQERSIWAIDRLLQSLSARRSVALFVDDAHHAGSEDARALEHLARHLAPRGVLFLVASRDRPEGRTAPAADRLASLPDALHLKLGPLSRTDSLRLLEESAGDERVEPAEADRIHTLAQGNPLFTLELWRHLRSGGEVSGEALPRHFHDLVAARVQQLSADERGLLDAAAVDGIVFDGEAVAAVLGEPLLLVLRRLQAIQRRHGLIAASEHGYRFVNAAFQEVILADLAPSLRRELHVAFAEHLATRPGVAPERLAAHWDGAGQPEKARPLYLQAMLDAGFRQECRRVCDFAARAGLGPGRLSAEELREASPAMFALAGSEFYLGRPERARAILEELDLAAQQLDDEPLRLKARVRLAGQLFRTEGPQAVDRAELERAAERLPAHMDRGRALYLLGRIAKYEGDLDGARDWLEKADLVFRDQGREDEHSSTLDLMASVAARAGRNAEADRLYGDAARIARRLGRMVDAATSEFNRANLAFQDGRLEGLAERLRETADTLRLEGAPALAGHVLVHLSAVCFAGGDRPGAEQAVEEALEQLGPTRESGALREAHFRRAYLQATAGRLDAARESLDSAQGHARGPVHPDIRICLAALEAQICCWAEEPGRARGVVEEAIRAAGERLGEALSERSAIWLVETVVYGLDADPVRGFVAADSESFPDHERADAVAMLASAEAFGHGSGAHSGVLAAGADALRRQPGADRRPVLTALAALWDAEAARRAGRPAESRRLAAEAREVLRRPGHVWLERLLEPSG